MSMTGASSFGATAGARASEQSVDEYARCAGRFVTFSRRAFVVPLSPTPAEIVQPQNLDYQRSLSFHRGLSDSLVKPLLCCTPHLGALCKLGQYARHDLCPIEASLSPKQVPWYEMSSDTRN